MDLHYYQERRNTKERRYLVTTLKKQQEDTAISQHIRVSSGVRFHHVINSWFYFTKLHAGNLQLYQEIPA